MLDVLVVGGGAAGLFAATAAARHGARTLLLERNRRAGVKVLASGGSRCNVTSMLPAHAMAREFGRAGGRFLGHALRVLSPADVVRLLEEGGVPTYEERFDKVFPRSNRATDVLAVFLLRLREAGAELRLEARVTTARRSPEGIFEVPCGDALFRSRALVIATGGQSYPKTGSTGDGYAIARAFGHTVGGVRPALVPLLAADAWVTESTGIAFQDVAVRLVDATGATLATRRRPLLFTHFGLSGPAAMDVSRSVGAGAGTTALAVDFAPDVAAAELDRLLEQAASAAPRERLGRALPLALPERFAVRLLESAGLDASRRLVETSRRDRAAVVARLKAAAIPIQGTQGFARAEVTAGGVALDEVDPRTMESRRCPGLYLCGELLDLDGPIGGFNFQAAFSTGRLAGTSAATRS